jgi:hypothetical protein
MVIAEKKRQKIRKQKPPPPLWGQSTTTTRESASMSPLSSGLSQISVSPMAATSLNNHEDLRKSLQGLSIIIVHVKTALFPSFVATSETPSTGKEGAENGTSAEDIDDTPIIDPRTMQVRILDELVEMEMQENLGVHFVMAKQGMKIEC